MRVLYLSQARLPSMAANSVHVVKMCSAIGALGHSVTLLGYMGEQEDPLTYYDVPANFDIRTFDITQKPGESIWLALKSLIWHFRDSRKVGTFELVYSRSAICLFFNLCMGRPFIYEVHSIPRTSFHAFMERRILGSKHLKNMVFISDQLRSWYKQRYPQAILNKDRLLPDAADAFVKPGVSAELRGTSSCKVGYLGHLYRGKGGETIVALAQAMPDVDFHVVGGRPEDITRLELQGVGPNVFFYGHVAHRETKRYLQAFDIVLAPYAQQVHLAHTNVDIGQWMSPLKLFEYMSASKPIIASDLAVLREILSHEHNALLAEPENIESWVGCVRTLMNNPDLKKSIAAQALNDFERKYTWRKRAEQVVPSEIC